MSNDIVTAEATVPPEEARCSIKNKALSDEVAWLVVPCVDRGARPQGQHLFDLNEKLWYAPPQTT